MFYCRPWAPYWCYCGGYRYSQCTSHPAQFLVNLDSLINSQSQTKKNILLTCYVLIWSTLVVNLYSSFSIILDFSIHRSNSEPCFSALLFGIHVVILITCWHGGIRRALISWIILERKGCFISFVYVMYFIFIFFLQYLCTFLQVFGEIVLKQQQYSVGAALSGGRYTSSTVRNQFLTEKHFKIRSRGGEWIHWM